MVEFLNALSEKFGTMIIMDVLHAEHKNVTWKIGSNDSFEEVIKRFSTASDYEYILFNNYCFLRRRWKNGIDLVPDVSFEEIFYRLEYACKQFAFLGFSEIDTVFTKKPPGEGWRESIYAKFGLPNNGHMTILLNELDEGQLSTLDMMLRYTINLQINDFFRINRFFKMVKSRKAWMNKGKINKNAPEMYSLIGEFRKIGQRSDLLFTNGFVFSAKGVSSNFESKPGYVRMNSLGMSDNNLSDKFFENMKKEIFTYKAKDICNCDTKKSSLKDLFADLSDDALGDAICWISKNFKKMDKLSFEKMVDYLYGYQLIRQTDNRYILRGKYADKKELVSMNLNQLVYGLIPVSLKNLLVDTVLKERLKKEEMRKKHSVFDLSREERIELIKSEYEIAKRPIWDLYVEKICREAEGIADLKEGIPIDELSPTLKGDISALLLIDSAIEVLSPRIETGMNYSWLSSLKNYKLEIYDGGSRPSVFSMNVVNDDKRLMSASFQYI